MTFNPTIITKKKKKNNIRFMDEMGALPAPDTVLNKLKSDGTFDQFRKSCLSALESEVGVRC